MGLVCAKTKVVYEQYQIAVSQFRKYRPKIQVYWVLLDRHIQSARGGQSSIADIKRRDHATGTLNL
jgi:hypothetical protein